MPSISEQEQSALSVALYQPDIPQNTGAIMRLCACFGLPLHIIEPCGFVFDDRRVRQAGMDYRDAVDVRRHMSWQAFLAAPPGRLVLATTRGAVTYTDFAFAPGDVLIMGRESAGVPDMVAEQVDQRIYIPMRPGMRSLNVAMSAGIIASEAVRQLKLG